MLIFLYGQNSYSLIQYVNQLISRYRKKYPESFNFHKFDLEEADLNEVEDVIKGKSFFKQIKFVVIKNPFVNPATLRSEAKSDFLEKIIKENGLEKQKDSVFLLYQTGTNEELKKKDEKLFSLLAKTGQTKEFKLPTSQAASKFASAYLAKHPEGKLSASYGASKISIKKEALAKLVKETGPDFWRLQNELDKIISFAKQEKKTNINEGDIAKLVNFKTDHNIFDMTEAAFSNQAKALVLFNDYFASGGDPLYLLSMIAFQLKNMLIVRELADKNWQYGQILKKTGMHPYFFKKNYEAAQKYTLDDLKKIFQKAVDFEIALKTGQAEAENIFFKIFL